MTKEKIITSENISFEVPGNTVIYTVPTGMKFIPKSLVFKTNILTSYAGDGAISVVRKSDGQIIFNGSSSDVISQIIPGARQIELDGIDIPTLEAGDKIEVQILGEDTGDDVNFDIEVSGTLSGESVIGMAEQNYTDIEALENYLGITIPVGQVDQYNSYIQAMSRYMDSYCNRVLFDDTVQTFKYDGDGSEILLIKDCVDITEVKVDNEAVDYFKYPKNKPYASRITLDGYKFPHGRENVSVTGIQAMSSVLKDDIKHACTVLVAGIHNARSAQGKVGTTERINNYSITYKDEAQKIDFETAKATLAGYKRIAL